MTNEDKALGERLLLADCKLDGRKLEDYADQLCREAAATIARLSAENEALKAALIRLRDCDWVITPLDRMDAVRDIAHKALEGTQHD